MRQRAILVNGLALLITSGALAQTVNQEPTVAELQRQLQEMRSQMDKMQNRIAELEAARGVAATNSSTNPTKVMVYTTRGSTKICSHLPLEDVVAFLTTLTSSQYEE